MERRHFELIAKIIADLRAAGLDESEHACVTRNFARQLAPTNPAFNRARFLKACGVETEDA